MDSLAHRALEHSAALGWKLLDLPAQLRISTIDSFCRELALQQPLLSGLGGGLEIAEQPDELYRRAARETLSKIDQTGSALGAAIEELLLWRDNGWQEMEELLVEMLESRDRWMHGFVLEREPDWEALRERLERPFANAVRDALIELSRASRSGSRRARRSAGTGALCLRAERRPCFIRNSPNWSSFPPLRLPAMPILKRLARLT